jgi:hypothetical protein
MLFLIQAESFWVSLSSAYLKAKKIEKPIKLAGYDAGKI